MALEQYAIGSLNLGIQNPQYMATLLTATASMAQPLDGSAPYSFNNTHQDGVIIRFQSPKPGAGNSEPYLRNSIYLRTFHDGGGNDNGVLQVRGNNDASILIAHFSAYNGGRFGLGGVISPQAVLHVNGNSTFNGSLYIGGSISTIGSLFVDGSRNITAGTIGCSSITGTSTIQGTTFTATGLTGLTLSNATSNLISFGTAGSGLPTTTTRSAGTKLVLYPSLSSTLVDHALGVTSGVFWQSISQSTDSFKWYAGTALIGTLTGAGIFNPVGGLQINGNACIDSTRNITCVNLTSTGVTSFSAIANGNKVEKVVSKTTTINSATPIFSVSTTAGESGAYSCKFDILSTRNASAGQTKVCSRWSSYIYTRAKGTSTGVNSTLVQLNNDIASVINDVTVDAQSVVPSIAENSELQTTFTMGSTWVSGTDHTGNEEFVVTVTVMYQGFVTPPTITAL